jgi:hypothetical protein
MKNIMRHSEVKASQKPLVKKYEGKTLLGQSWQLFQGDALEALKQLDDEIVD